MTATLEAPARTGGQRLRRCLPGTDGKRYRYRQETGAPAPWVDATRVQAHIDQLIGWGLTYVMIADAAGISDYAVNRQHRRQATLVYRHYEQAILAVNHLPHPAQFRVLAVGARRRVEALAADGWTQRFVAERVGVSSSTELRRIVEKPTMRAHQQRAIVAVYADIDGKPGPSAKASTWARKAGWHGSWAWDDDTIDHPDAQPVDYSRPSTAATINADDVHELRTHGLTAAQVAERLGITTKQVEYAERSYQSRDAHRAKQRITDAQVEQLRLRVVTAGEDYRAVAAEYGISPSTASNIISGRERRNAAGPARGGGRRARRN